MSGAFAGAGLIGKPVFTLEFARACPRIRKGMLFRDMR